MIPRPSEEKRPIDQVGGDVSFDDKGPDNEGPESLPNASSMGEAPTELDFEQYREGLRCFLKSRLGHDSDVDDCLQNVSLKWIQHRASIPKSVVRPWLFTVAANESALAWRKRARNQQVMQSLAEQSSEYSESQDNLDRHETQEIVRQAVSRLPEDMQAVVRLRLESDATFEQIAEQLRIPLGTALSRMHRALAKLEKELETLN